MKSVIYETKGRAREFNELAVNIFTGCGHQCIYCYGADVTHQTQESFGKCPQIRVTTHDVLESAKSWKAKGETRRVLLCFVTDPYQPIEQETMLTRKCIMALHEVGLNVIILTKGGKRAMRDFDLLTPHDAFATTLTCLTNTPSRYWEPNAALPRERIQSLMEAHDRGIETWVSLEPVIYPHDIFELIMFTHKIVGHYKIGRFNYANKLSPEARDKLPTINWYEFGWKIKQLCDSQGIKYYFKNDLLKEMGVAPTDFKQTWVCR